MKFSLLIKFGGVTYLLYSAVLRLNSEMTQFYLQVNTMNTKQLKGSILGDDLFFDPKFFHSGMKG
jgi:arginine exporter protein ArgO